MCRLIIYTINHKPSNNQGLAPHITLYDMITGKRKDLWSRNEKFDEVDNK